MWTRSFHSCAPSLARTKPLSFGNLESVKLRPPIAPTHKNFDVPPDHPLWAFFPDGNKCDTPLRESSDLDTQSRVWAFSELRRKSFEDLHVLWYKVLRDRNILAREVRVAESLRYPKIDSHQSIDQDLITVQKRIKQVLLERQTAYERVQTMAKEQNDYLSEFEQRYIAADAGEISALDEKLERLLYAFFGIDSDAIRLQGASDIDEKFVEGVMYVARLKLSRYLANNPDDSDFALVGIMEEAPFLLQSAEDAMAEITEMRQAGISKPIPKNETFEYLKTVFATTQEDA